MEEGSPPLPLPGGNGGSDSSSPPPPPPPPPPTAARSGGGRWRSSSRRRKEQWPPLRLRWFWASGARRVRHPRGSVHEPEPIAASKALALGFCQHEELASRALPSCAPVRYCTERGGWSLRGAPLGPEGGTPRGDARAWAACTPYGPDRRVVRVPPWRGGEDRVRILVRVAVPARGARRGPGRCTLRPCAA